MRQRLLFAICQNTGRHVFRQYCSAHAHDGQRGGGFSANAERAGCDHLQGITLLRGEYRLAGGLHRFALHGIDLAHCTGKRGAVETQRDHAVDIRLCMPGQSPYGKIPA